MLSWALVVDRLTDEEVALIEHCLATEALDYRRWLDARVDELLAPLRRQSPMKRAMSGSDVIDLLESLEGAAQ